MDNELSSILSLRLYPGENAGGVKVLKLVIALVKVLADEEVIIVKISTSIEGSAIARSVAVMNEVRLPAMLLWSRLYR